MNTAQPAATHLFDKVVAQASLSNTQKKAYAKWKHAQTAIPWLEWSAKAHPKWRRALEAIPWLRLSASASEQWDQVKDATVRIRGSRNDRPWERRSIFQMALKELEAFEDSLLRRYQGRSKRRGIPRGNLKRWERPGFKREFAMFRMIVELCHVVLRKQYFDKMLQNETERTAKVAHKATTAPKKRFRGPPKEFWMEMAHSLFFHASLLQEHILHIHELYLDEDHLENGRDYPPMFAFGLWQACSLSSYLWMHPGLNKVSAATAKIERQRDANLEDYLRVSPLDQGANTRAQNCFEILSYATRGRVAPFVLANQEDNVLLVKMAEARTDFHRGVIVGSQTPKHLWADLMTGMSWSRRARYGALPGDIDANRPTFSTDGMNLVKNVFEMEMEAEREGEFERFFHIPPKWSSYPSEESP